MTPGSQAAYPLEGLKQPGIQDDLNGNGGSQAACPLEGLKLGYSSSTPEHIHGSQAACPLEGLKRARTPAVVLGCQRLKGRVPA